MTAQQPGPRIVPSAEMRAASSVSYGSQWFVKRRKQTDRIHAWVINIDGQPYNGGCGMPWAWHDWEGRCPGVTAGWLGSDR